jgi:hypothetical protein
MADYFKISGYWKDDKSEFSDMIVKSDSGSGDETDDKIFYYGLDEFDIEQAIEEVEDSSLEFVITEYEDVTSEFKKEAIEAFLRGLEKSANFEFDLCSNVDAGNAESFDDIVSQLDDNNPFDVEIIYYSRAMEYLTENDTSLKESLEIADEMGFSPRDLSSETLASLLASRLERDKFYEYKSEIEEFFESL